MIRLGGSLIDALVTHWLQQSVSESGNLLIIITFLWNPGERYQGFDGSRPATDGWETSGSQPSVGGHPERAEWLLGEEETVFSQVSSIVLLFEFALLTHILVELHFFYTESWLLLIYSMSFSDGSVGKESTCSVETWVQSLGWEDLLEEGMATHFSILAWRIPMHRGACQATIHGVAKSWTQLSD